MCNDAFRRDREGPGVDIEGFRYAPRRLQRIADGLPGLVASGLESYCLPARSQGFDRSQPVAKNVGPGREGTSLARVDIQGFGDRRQRFVTMAEREPGRGLVDEDIDEIGPGHQ